MSKRQRNWLATALFGSLAVGGALLLLTGGREGLSTARAEGGSSTPTAGAEEKPEATGEPANPYSEVVEPPDAGPDVGGIGLDQLTAKERAAVLADNKRDADRMANGAEAAMEAYGKALEARAKLIEAARVAGVAVLP